MEVRGKDVEQNTSSPGMAGVYHFAALPKRHYSGDGSKWFWDRVNKHKKDKRFGLMYIAGCALQEHEARVLQMLSELEAKK